MSCELANRKTAGIGVACIGIMLPFRRKNGSRSGLFESELHQKAISAVVQKYTHFEAQFPFDILMYSPIRKASRGGARESTKMCPIGAL